MANTKEITQFLGHVPLFIGLNDGQKERLAKRFVEREYDAGKTIVSQGLGGEGFFIIATGKATAYRTRSDGTKTEVNSFKAMDFFGELALLDDGLRTASVITTEPVKCYVITRWDFLSLLKEDSEMAINILIEVARRFRSVLDSM
jgi:CRP-like cAMP-binding protein